MKIHTTTNDGKWRLPCLVLMLSASYFTAFCSPAPVNGEDKITLHKKNASLPELINAIEKKTSYVFWFRADMLPQIKKISLSVKDVTVQQVMDLCAEGQPFTYAIIEQVIVLKPDSVLAKLLPKGGADTLSYRLEWEKPQFVSDGYSRTEKRLNTSSITKVEGSQLNQGSMSDVFSNTSINGMTSTADSRGNVSMQIRGRNSLMFNSAPLVILDGITYDGNINQINPAIVESINVLKDAGATSLYGSRGANGVIVINTKKGAEAGAATISSSGTVVPVQKGFYEYDYVHVYGIFRQLTEKYNLAVVYKSGVPGGRYKGRIPASLSVTQMLEIFYASGIQFNQERMPDGRLQIAVD